MYRVSRVVITLGQIYNTAPRVLSLTVGHGATYIMKYDSHHNHNHNNNNSNDNNTNNNNNNNNINNINDNSSNNNNNNNINNNDDNSCWHSMGQVGTHSGPSW